MKIAILSRKPQLYSTRRLVPPRWRGARSLGDHTLRCYMNISADNPTIHYGGRELQAMDAVIPRIGASITFYGTAVVRQFEMMRVYCLNDSVAIARARDKLRSLQLLSRKGVGMPITGLLMLRGH